MEIYQNVSVADP